MCREKGENIMAKKKVFISFDYDNDLKLKNLLAGQAKLQDSPFEISDWSLKEVTPEKDWEDKAEAKIKRSNIVVVIVGDKTSKASGVKKEVKIARKNNITIVQIKVQKTNPSKVADAGVLYDWTWDNLKSILK
ncbi:MAG TPA: TIR domain-containing protein [bacterium]|nr:TIR domain-containing protein [bacterium]